MGGRDLDTGAVGKTKNLLYRTFTEGLHPYQLGPFVVRQCGGGDLRGAGRVLIDQ